MIYSASLALLLQLVAGITLVIGNNTPTSKAGTALLAPVNRNITAGEAWVYPSSAFDLGARSMSCECFDPTGICCMPNSTAIAPFCAPHNTTCCADTFCLGGETCCGEFCCGANTTCNVKLSGSGCCPNGEICTSAPLCYDHSSSNCTNTLSPKAGCCPVDAPFCRDFEPTGMGCYASSLASTLSSTMVGFSSPGTTLDLASPIPTSMTTRKSRTATVTISVFQTAGGFSIDFGTRTTFPNAVSTAYVLDYPSSLPSGTGISKPVPVTPMPSTVSSALPSSSSLPTHPSTATSLHISLCFNDALQSPAPCIPTTTSGNPSKSTPAPSTTNIGYSPPGTSVLTSQASRSQEPFFSRIFTAIKTYSTKTITTINTSCLKPLHSPSSTYDPLTLIRETLHLHLLAHWPLHLLFLSTTTSSSSPPPLPPSSSTSTSTSTSSTLNIPPSTPPKKAGTRANEAGVLCEKGGERDRDRERVRVECADWLTG